MYQRQHGFICWKRRAALELSRALQLREAKKVLLVTAGGAEGPLRLRWPAGRREGAGIAGLSPAGRVGS